MQSFTPETILSADYASALKSFMNKDFDKSFPQILKTCSQSFISYEKGYLGQEMFSKIVCLYLTELGLVLSSKESQVFMLRRKERDQLIQDLKQGLLMTKLNKLFGSIMEIPSSLLFLLHLVYFTCQHHLCVEDPNFVLRQFESTYASIDTTKVDKNLTRLVEMYIFDVLPSADKWRAAYSIAETNPLFRDSDEAVCKLKEKEKVHKQETKLREQRHKERQEIERKLAEQEKERQRKKAEEKSLKFKSLKKIQKDIQKEKLDSSFPIVPDTSAFSTAEIKERLVYLYRLTRSQSQKYAPVVTCIIVIILVFFRVMNVKKINIREKIRETLSMAMKVTYM